MAFPVIMAVIMGHGIPGDEPVDYACERAVVTGTPHGVGMARKPPLGLKEGHAITIGIASIGELTNPVALGQIHA
jgi:hypothetical protein